MRVAVYSKWSLSGALVNRNKLKDGVYCTKESAPRAETPENDDSC